jgi:DNA (cytosine-5)-methyltransferase 1
MNVLSLFDGMSCGRIALVDMNIPIEKYYASEVDKHAIAQTMLNFPDTIQLGSVVDVDVSTLEHIDLLIGGSPCQSFSFAGKRKGMSTKCEIEITRLEQYLELKESGFEFEGQSFLFWEFMRILTDIRKYNPDVLFLLENVEMGVKWERVLSEAIGIYGVHINSALVSAQNRKRIYWTNIRIKKVGLFGELHADIPQPADRGILLKDILDRDVDEKYYLSDKMIKSLTTDKDLGNGVWKAMECKDEDEKSSTLTARYHKMGKSDTYVEVDKRLNPKANQDKASCFTAGGNHSDMDLICVSMVGRKTDENGTRKDYDPNIKAVQRLEPNLNGKTNCLTSVQKDNLVMQINPSKESGGKQPYQQNRIYDTEGISPALCANKADLLIKSGTLRTHKDGNGFREVQSGKGACVPARAREDGSGQNVAIIGNRIRRLTPTECSRLQTIPDWYRWECSATQQYRMLGNGWTVEIIKHIFSFL